MKRTGMGVGAVVLVVVAGLVVATNIGLIGIEWPWEKVDVLSDETEVAVADQAVVYEIEPIELDCRARIRASVPVEGRREHRVVGQVYRTDTVSMVAVGDIDACVDASSTEVRELVGGGFHVVVPAEAITFERPRVDAVATRNSVHFDKGFVGKITDVLPWVSDDSGLTPAAYAFAQDVVGSSECMERAWDVTELVLRRAYRAQMSAQGGDPSSVTVMVSGVPDFGPDASAVVDGYEFEVDAESVECALDTGAFGTDVTTDAATS